MLKSKNIKILLGLLALLILVLIFVKSIPFINFIPAMQQHKTQTMTIDLSTIRSVVNAVERKQIPQLQLLSIADSLLSQSEVTYLRNPFQIVSKKKMPKIIKPVQSKPKIIKTHSRPKIIRPDISLDGIIWDKHFPYTIINGNIHEIGDEIGGYIIHSISDTSITLLSDSDLYSIIFRKEK